MERHTSGNTAKVFKASFFPHSAARDTPGPATTHDSSCRGHWGVQGCPLNHFPPRTARPAGGQALGSREHGGVTAVTAGAGEPKGDAHPLASKGERGLGHPPAVQESSLSPVGDSQQPVSIQDRAPGSSCPFPFRPNLHLGKCCPPRPRGRDSPGDDWMTPTRRAGPCTPTQCSTSPFSSLPEHQ